VKKRILIGIGTGRCGTTSLAHLLSSASGSTVTHEKPSIRINLPWKFEEKCASKAVETLVGGAGPTAGDVAFYYLPYVEWISRAVPDATFVCIKRDKSETVESYMKKTKGRDHWSRACRYSDPWDRLYPKFDTYDKREAIGMYWDMYYQESERLERSGVRIKTFDMRLLNDESGVRQILEFCGLEASDKVVGIKKNSL
jgi:hypothetical protein